MPSYLYRCMLSASACGLASLTVPSLWSSSGLLGNTLSQLLTWKISFPTNSLKLLVTVPLFNESHPSPSPPCLCILHQAVKTTCTKSLPLGKREGLERLPSLGCTHRLLPHARGLGELVACRSGLSEPEWSEASLQTPEAILQMAQPLPNK